MEDRKVELEKPHIPQQQQDQPKEYVREYQRENPFKEYKSEQPKELQPREYPDYQSERPREYATEPSREQQPRVYASEFQRETSQRGDYTTAVYQKEQPPPPREYPSEYYSGSPPGLPYSKPLLPSIPALPIPIRSASPMNISIHREPITAFPLFHQVLPDIAQYHLGASKPNTSPEPSGAAGEHVPKRRQEPCRPGQEYPIDAPFDSRHRNPPTHPLFP
jgi:hypothetical protein